MLFILSHMAVTTAAASLSFTLHSGASQCFFRTHTTVTPLSALVSVALADPSLGPAIARSSTTLSCPAVPSGFLTGLYIPLFSQNLVVVGYLQDREITVSSPAHKRTVICTDASTGALLAMFTREPHSDLFVLRTMLLLLARLQRLAPVGLSPTRPSCSTTVLATHRSPASIAWVFIVFFLVSVASLPRSLPRLDRRELLASPAARTPLRTPPPFIQPLLPSRLSTWTYTTVFPLVKKSEVTSTLIRWLLTTEGTRGSRVRCLHSERGGKFRSGVLAGFRGEQGIRQSWTLLESPQQNGVAERRVGLVMDIAHTSMIHAQASPTSLSIVSLGVGSDFHVRGFLALVRDTSADKLSARTIPCVFLGFPVDSPDYAFYHSYLHQFLDSCDVQFDESVSYYTRHLCRGLPVPPRPLFLAPSPPPCSRSSGSPAPPCQRNERE
ncbi:unnamed protein product [Closterium sp. NIES-53]